MDYEIYKMEIIRFDEADVFTGLTPGSMDESGGGGSQHSVVDEPVYADM